jgi:hypothetical protein
MALNTGLIMPHKWTSNTRHLRERAFMGLLVPTLLKALGIVKQIQRIEAIERWIDGPSPG